MRDWIFCTPVAVAMLWSGLREKAVCKGFQTSSDHKTS